MKCSNILLTDQALYLSKGTWDVVNGSTLHIVLLAMKEKEKE